MSMVLVEVYISDGRISAEASSLHTDALPTQFRKQLTLIPGYMKSHDFSGGREKEAASTMGEHRGGVPFPQCPLD